MRTNFILFYISALIFTQSALEAIVVKKTGLKKNDILFLYGLLFVFFCIFLIMMKKKKYISILIVF